MITYDYDNDCLLGPFSSSEKFEKQIDHSIVSNKDAHDLNGFVLTEYMLDSDKAIRSYKYDKKGNRLE
jgi:hypothetical protein